MLRFRRYRVFLLFAALTLFVFWRFSSPARWEQSAHTVDSFKQQLGLREGKSTQERQQQEPLRPKPKPESGPPKSDPQKVPPPPVPSIAKPKQQLPSPKPSPKPSSAAKPKPISPPPGEVIREGNEDGERLRLIPGAPSPESVEQVIVVGGQGRKEEDWLPADAKLIRWEKPEEHFPVTSTIQLPSGKPTPLPKIQAKFDEESPADKKARQEKLDVIKEAFVHAWEGYKEYAWGKDELMPVTANWKNPFNGWGATLIDSLDILWMMGMKKDFEEAVDAVAKVDFKTSRRADIPVFETVIRFLGGLLGAYDVSEGKYRVLLDKAVELGEILMGAFDTPNRMPITFYQWKPTFASQPHRAPTRLVLAELGSLAVEFTRLAQITKEPKYYDAIARITDALQEWQNHTNVPGLWPIYIDASGCAKVEYSNSYIQTTSSSAGTGQNMVPLEKPPPLVFSSNKGSVDEADSKASSSGPAANAMPGGLGGNPYPEKAPSQEGSSAKGRIQGWDANHGGEKASDTAKKAAEQASPQRGSPSEGKIAGWDGNHGGEKPSGSSKENVPLDKPEPLVFDVKSGSKKQKRQLGDPETDWENETLPNVPTIPEPPTKAFVNRLVYTPEPFPECAPHGLTSYNSYGTEEFTLGSMADSTYEYFPKEYIMLNGLNEQYREMYSWAADVAAEKLLFRVMIPDEKREILVAGEYSYTVPFNERMLPKEKLHPSGSHLTCFVGGMFGLGAKIFDRPKDLELAKKLTDGCVWAYESTITGIMPETFEAVPCKSRTSCPWNETKWWEELDPNWSWREQSYQRQYQVYLAEVAARESSLRESASQSAAVAAMRRTVTKSEETFGIQTAPPHPARDGSESSSPSAEEERGLKKRAAIDSRGSSEELGDPRLKDKNIVPKTKATNRATSTATARRTSTSSDEDSYYTPPPTRVFDTLPPIYSPEPPTSHEEWVQRIIKEDHIPEGMSVTPDHRYILRPEALESVFYMYRITGDQYWRTAGWKMISAILKHTRAEFGHSGIDDVRKENPVLNDSMESFWLAETLKYAWMLFTEESEWSLDDWVLNTEAHLLRRPDAPPFKR